MLKISQAETQSGKANLFLVIPIHKCIQENIFPIVVLPPRVCLRKQTVSRIIQGPKFTDQYYENIEESEMAFTDSTSNRIDNKTLLKRIEKGKTKVFIVLNNHCGLVRLVSLVHSLLIRGKKLNIFVDEIHSCLDLNIKEIDIEKNTKRSYELLKLHMNKKIIDNEELDSFNRDQLWNWLIYEIQENLTIKGITATVTPLIFNKYWKESSVKLEITRHKVPEIYCGFDSFHKANTKGVLNAFNSILKKSLDKCVVMFHAKREKISHFIRGKQWNRYCRKNNKKDYGFFIDNGDGWILYDENNEELERFRKNGDFNEPWEAIEYFVKNYKKKYILITGKFCMGMGTTYQKCDNKHDVVIDHLILFTEKKDITKFSGVQQEIGRLCTNDPLLRKRTLWCTPEVHAYIEKSYVLERKISENGKV